MEITEDFLKLLQIALIVVGVLAIYFSYMSYNITVDARKGERDAIILGNTLLSSDCLTYSDTQSLFSEDKLNNIQADSTCLSKQYPFGAVNVELQDLSKKWSIDLGPFDMGSDVTLAVAVINSTTGEIKPASMLVKV